MSQRRKIAREVSLGRLPEAALDAPDHMTLGQVRDLYPEVNEAPAQMSLPLEPPAEPVAGPAAEPVVEPAAAPVAEPA